MSNKVPKWVEQSVEDFTTNAPREDGSWRQDSPKQWSTPVAIHYPTLAHVYYVVDRLDPDHADAVEGWVELKGNHLIQELADNAARKHAYHGQVPHRVRMVVWDG